MNKQKTLKFVNALLAADFFVLVLSVLFRPILAYEVYRITHPIPGFLLVVGVGTHLFLNWAWVKQNYLKDTRKQTER